MATLTVIAFITTIYIHSASAQKSPPNIIIIMADDMGWNDVSFHGSPEIPTPNIDALAASGIVLQNYYAAPQCTPSRASLMTGKYPINTGLQHYVIRAAEPTALPLNFKIMPQYFKEMGYATHIIGKWHLGYFKSEYLPTNRGFDSFFGFVNGMIDYYDYTYYSTNTEIKYPMWGIDLYNNTTPIRNFRAKYSTDVFTEKAVEKIENHPDSEPLFLYVAHNAPHTGLSFMKLQAPPEEIVKFKYIKDSNRRTYAAMVSKLDESVGKIFEALNRKGMLDNSIIIFASDNGGAPGGPAGASNYPLRGAKLTLWEGGIRVPALIWSPLLQLTEPTVSNQLIHISDWLPTLYMASNGNISKLESVDGFNMWPYLTNRSPSPRTEMILNIDPFENSAGLRFGDYKLVKGDFRDGFSTWTGSSGKNGLTEYLENLDTWVWKDGSVVKDILEKRRQWLIREPNTWRKNLTVECGEKSHNHHHCDTKRSPCLFNIVRDPCEYNNLALHYPKIVRTMMQRIRRYNATLIPPLTQSVDPRGDPKCHGFSFVPWLDEERKSACPYL